MASVTTGAAVGAPPHFVDEVAGIISKLIGRGLDNPPVYYKLCLYLASGIDLAIINKEVPPRCSSIPHLLKQVYAYKKDSSFEAAFTVLMISIKSACKAGWFSNKDAYILELLSKEAVKGFSNPEDVDIGPSCSLPYISNILSRCNPQMKMEKVIVSLGVKAGFGAYVSDFNISRDTITSQHEKIFLFVVLTENVVTSSHIVTPPQINLMLNGITVQKGNKIYSGIGQELITNVTTMLEGGVNLLQAVGQFNGSYVIALATTSIIPSSGNSVNSELHDNNQQVTASVSSDLGSKNYKTSWQISLKCPISRCRINIPVKGNICKHLECFDYETFLEINSKEPSWRCPICKLPAGRTDLHVDQRFYKVLKESPTHVNNVIISKDGSWKPVSMSKDRLESNVWSDILQVVSLAEGEAPGSSTSRGNVKPNNTPLNIRPTPPPLQHHSMNQPTAVRSAQQLPRRGSDGPRPWLSQQHSAGTGPKMLETAAVPTRGDKVGRMRGSLTGQAYDDAFSRLMSPPTQSAQASSQPNVLPHHPFVVPVHLPPPNRTDTPGDPP